MGSLNLSNENGNELEAEEIKSNSINDEENGAGASAIVVETTEMPSFIASIKDLPITKNYKSKKSELISNEEVIRIEKAHEIKQARKALWIVETENEIAKRVQFRNSDVPELFPVHVWKQILEQVDSSKGKAILSNICLTWREALEMERTTFLFHEVFPLLWLNGQLPKDLLSWLDYRLVSQEWNRAIKNAIQIPIKERPLSLLEAHQVREPLTPTVDPIFIEFEMGTNDVIGYLEWSKMSYPSNGNPFCSRKLRFGCVSPHALTTSMYFWIQLKCLLALWGKEVWHMEFHFSRDNPLNSGSLYALFCMLLGQTPNLRYFGYHSSDDTPIEEGTNKLKPMLDIASLPDLPHLSTIVAESIPHPILKAMLEKYGNTLEQVVTRGLHTPQYTFGNSKLPKLKSFILSSTRSYEEDELKLSVDWPSIEELDIHYKIFDTEGIPELFESLKCLGKSLRKLDLKLEQRYRTPEKLDAKLLKDLFLELPNLEYFSMSMGLGAGNLRSIDFIVPMVALKELTVCYAKSKKFNFNFPRKRKAMIGIQPDPDRFMGPNAISFFDEDGPDEIIKFWKYTTQLYESNIWRLLPELRKVTIIVAEIYDGTGSIKEKVYTREEYKSYLRGMGRWYVSGFGF